MINHPFAYDGIVIYGDLAKLYITGASSGLNQEQAPIFLSILLFFTKIFGFSYPKVLLGQLLLFTTTHVCLLHIYCNIKDNKKYKFDFYNLLLWTSFCFVLLGILKVNPGGILDFRRDLWGALLLSYAILFLPFFNLSSILIILICIIERFHCLPVLIVYCGILCVLFKNTKPARSIFLSVLLYLTIRWNHFVNLIYYYRGHIGISDGSNIGIHSFTERIYYSFYPASLIRNYLGPSGLISIFIIFFIILKFVPFKKVSSTAFKSEPQKTILIGSLIALFLLILNKTRNNEGVLRYFLIPFSFYLAFFLKDIAQYFKVKIFVNKKFYIKILFLSVPVIILLACGLHQIQYLLNYDYKGIKKYEFRTKSYAQMTELYNYAKIQKKLIRAGSNYVSDLNFTEWQWNAFLAENKLSYIPYSLEIGGEYLVSNEKLKNYKNLINELLVIYSGTDTCNDNVIPSSTSIAELKFAFNERIKSSCKETSTISRLENCEIRSFICY